MKIFNIPSITFFNISAQVVALIGFMFFTRLFTPEFLGEYIVYISFLSILGVMCTGFYEQALFIEDDAKKYSQILAFVIMLCGVFSLISYFFLILFEVEYAFYISIAVFSTGIRVLSKSFAIIKVKLLSLSVLEFVFSPVIPLLIVTLQYLSEFRSAGELIKIHSLLSFLLSLIHYYVFVSRDRGLSYSSLSYSELFYTARRYINQPLYRLPSGLITSLYLRAPTFFIDSKFSTSMAAFYGVSFRIALTPVSIITATASQIFVAKLKHNKNNGMLAIKDFKQFVAFMLIVASVLLVCIFLFSSVVVGIVFPEEYAPVAVMLKSFAPYIFSLIVISPITSTFVVYEKQAYLLYSNVFILCTTVASYYFSSVVGDLYLGIFLFSLSYLAVYVWIFIKAFKIVRYHAQSDT